MSSVFYRLTHEATRNSILGFVDAEHGGDELIGPALLMEVAHQDCNRFSESEPARSLPISEADHYNIDMALAQDTLLNRPFGEAGRKLMAQQLQAYGRELWIAAGCGSQSDQLVRRIHIAELARVLHEQRIR